MAGFSLSRKSNTRAAADAASPASGHCAAWMRRMSLHGRHTASRATELAIRWTSACIQTTVGPTLANYLATLPCALRNVSREISGYRPIRNGNQLVPMPGDTNNVRSPT